jgi:hypothetical protein
MDAPMDKPKQERKEEECQCILHIEKENKTWKKERKLTTGSQRGKEESWWNAHKQNPNKKPKGGRHRGKKR